MPKWGSGAAPGWRLLSLCAVGILIVGGEAAVGMATARASACVGDCDGDCVVAISELIRGVNISLGSLALDSCPAFDADGDGAVAINELIRGVGNALGGCGEQCVGSGSPTPTPTPTGGVETPGTTTPGAPTPNTPTPATRTPGTQTSTPSTATLTPVATSVPTATRTTAPTPGGGLVLAGARALDPTTVRVTFNGAIEMGSGLDKTNYAITEVDTQIAGGPEIVDVNFLRVCDGGQAQGQICNDAVDPSRGDDSLCPDSQCATEDRRAVLLSTSAHSGRQYKLTVTGVRDTAGNTIIIGPIGDRRNEQVYSGKPPESILYCPKATAAHTLQTGRCEPVRCTVESGCGSGCIGGANANLACEAAADCPGGTCGTLPCVQAVPDCDGDGLTDDKEAEGWQVVITQHPDPINHPEITTTTTRRETSNPLRVDTDNDGLPDNEEFHSRYTGSISDPRNRDTDNDAIDDYQEVVLLRSNPADSDSDADGITDYVEVNQNGSSPTVADSDGDSIPDGADYQANGGDPRLADLPAFEIQVDNPIVTFNYSFVFTQNGVKTAEETGNVMATLSDMSSQSNTETDTAVKEWSAKAALHAEAEAAYPTGFSASAKVTLDADVGASGRNEITKESADRTAKELQKSNTTTRSLMSGETVERTVSGATVTASVRFSNTGAFAMCLDNILIQMRTPDPDNPGEFIPLGTLAPVGLNAPIELGPLTTMHTVQFSASLDTQSVESVQRFMRNPRNIIFDVGNFTVKSDPSGTTDACAAPSYITTEQRIVNNTGELTVDFAGEGGRDVKHFFVSTNLGRQEAVRDLNGDDQIDAQDAEQVLYTPDGTYLYPRLTDALDIAGIPYSVDPVTGQFTSVGDVDNAAAPDRKAWIILIRNDKRGTSRISDASLTYCGEVNAACPAGPTRVEDVTITPGVQIWITYLQDNDKDGVARSAEELYGTSDDNPDSDGDSVSDFDEIYKPVSVTVTNREGEQVSFEAHSNPVLLDSDGDGVRDDVERTMQTAPDRADTDGDGLEDGTDPDPLVYGCVPHLFRFQVSSQTDPFDPTCGVLGCRQGFFANDYTQQAKLGCSVTIHAPHYIMDTLAPFNDALSVKSLTGYASCQFTNCAIDACARLGTETGGACVLQGGQPLFSCNGFGAVSSASGSYYLQCSN